MKYGEIPMIDMEGLTNLELLKTGSVTFSVAKPEEIGHIYSACRMRGLSISKGLQDAYRKCHPNGIM